MIGLTEKILIEIVLLLSRDKAQDRKAWRKLVKQSEEKGGDLMIVGSVLPSTPLSVHRGSSCEHAACSLARARLLRSSWPLSLVIAPQRLTVAGLHGIVCPFVLPQLQHELLAPLTVGREAP